MSGLLSNGTLQTIAIIAGPLLVPRLITAGRRLMGSKAQSGPPASRRPDSARLGLIRLGLVTVGVCFALLMASSPPRNLFLAPAQTTPQHVLPLLRPTLALRLPSDTLAHLWERDLGRPLSPAESHLVAACTSSLDARKLYLAFGAAPLVGCTWCRTDDVAGRGDLVAYVTTAVAGTYLGVAGIGAGLLSGERVRWRGWFVAALGVGFVSEAWWRMSWAGPSNSTVVLLHTTLHIARHVYFAVLLFLAYFVRPRLVPVHPSLAGVLEPPLVVIGSQAEHLFHRLRVLSSRRMGVPQNGRLRGKVSPIWVDAEQDTEGADGRSELQAAQARGGAGGASGRDQEG